MLSDIEYTNGLSTLSNSYSRNYTWSRTSHKTFRYLKEIVDESKKVSSSQVCRNCVMDTTDPKIKFDENGVCDHCRTFYFHTKPIWQIRLKSDYSINKMVKEIKNKGNRKDYDCIIGLSGGIDSSYLTYYAVKKIRSSSIGVSC